MAREARERRAAQYERYGQALRAQPPDASGVEAAAKPALPA
jgi:hypothetical protein